MNNYKCMFNDVGKCNRPDSKYVNGCIGINNCTYKKIEKLEDHFEYLFWKFDSERSKKTDDERTIFKTICRQLIHKYDTIK